MAIEKDPYKGVRDFYPEDMAIQNYIFEVMRGTAESYGYEEYNASILEPAELYRAKSGDELVNDQTYTFTDRGDREVTLRPEMTPTLARMVAKKRKEMSFPLRWFSIANFFRYERPQRGRLREFWQLNADIFGVEDLSADVEIINIAYDIMRNFNIKDRQFEIRVNDVGSTTSALEQMGLDEDQINQIKVLLDKKDKIKDFDEQVEKVVGQKLNLEIKPSDSVNQVINSLNERGINNVIFDPAIMRGADYYTGIVFEVFDTGTENNRSLFGGGRYDKLLEIFGDEPLPAVGFGMGDVTIRDMLSTYGLLPEVCSSTDIYICVVNEESLSGAQDLAADLRDDGLNVVVDTSGKKVGDQIQKADKSKIPYVICVGQEELTNRKYKIKNLITGTEIEVSEAEIQSAVGVK